MGANRKKLHQSHLEWREVSDIKRLQCHSGKSGGHDFVSSSATESFQSVDYYNLVTELGTPKNMAAAIPGITLQPLYRMPEYTYTC